MSLGNSVAGDLAFACYCAVTVPHPSSEPALLTGDFDFGVALRFFGLGFVN